MKHYSISKRIIAIILLCSQHLMSCSNFMLDKKGLNKVQGEATTTMPSIVLHDSPYIESTRETGHQLIIEDIPEDSLTGGTVAIQASIRDNLWSSFNAYQKSKNKRGHSIPCSTLKHQQSPLKTHTLLQTRPLQPALAKHRQTIAGEIVGRTFTLRTGQEVSFYQKSGILKASLYEKYDIFRRSVEMPVYIIGGMTRGQFIPDRHIHIIPSEKGASHRGVYIGQIGLLGGMYHGVGEEEGEEVCKETTREELDNEELREFRKFREVAIAGGTQGEEIDQHLLTALNSGGESVTQQQPCSTNKGKEKVEEEEDGHAAVMEKGGVDKLAEYDYTTLPLLLSEVLLN